jgi:hypothetical protein
MGDLVNLRTKRRQAEQAGESTVAVQQNGLWRGRGTTRPGAVSTKTGSKRETGNEIAGHQALYRHRRP